jgi:GDP-mannose 6-dehydrogenase
VNISIFGLGYVGCVSSACLARLGHTVIGVDVNPLKVELLDGGRSPIVESGLDVLVRDMVAAGRLSATTDQEAAVAATELSMICVGTPSLDSGRLDLTYVRRIGASIAATLSRLDHFHVIVLRSTVLPGTVETCFIPLLEEQSGRRAGRDFGVAYNPEFLREGSALDDFEAPPYTVIAATDSRSAAAVERAYGGVEAPVERVDFPTAEMLKYVNNTFHALKVTFANEIGRVCKQSGIDSHRVMELFCRDTKLNISPTYLKPGFAFGGSCLPKDLRALSAFARQSHVEVPLLDSILESNREQVDSALRIIARTRKRRIGVLGLTFKAGTDDIRESPIVKVVEALVGRGLELHVHDANIDVARMVGTNREFLEHEIPYLESILRPTVDAVLENADVVVIATNDPAYRDVPGRLRPEQVLVDLVRIVPNGRPTGERYLGICW